jgi:hypothetical protein
MFSIGAWRRPWIAAGALAWVGAMVVNASAFAGVDFPDAVGWTLFIAAFPLIFAAVFTHPHARVRGARARIGFRAAIRGAWPPYIALAMGSVAYMIVVTTIVHVHRVRMGHHLSLVEMEAVSALCAVFYAWSTMIQSSALSAEQIPFDPDPADPAAGPRGAGP